MVDLAYKNNEIKQIILAHPAMSNNEMRNLKILKDSEELIKKFIIRGQVDHFSICELFFTMYPDIYVYDADNARWYAVDEYGMYHRDTNELSSAIMLLGDPLMNACSTAYFNILTDPTNNKIKEEITKTHSIIEKYLTSLVHRKNIVKFLKEKYLVTKFAERSNENKEIFAFNNGVYDMKTFEFRNARKEEFVTETCEYDYVKSSDEDRNIVFNIIKDMFIEKKLLDYVLHIFSMRLVRWNISEEFYLLIGKSSSGKGLITRLAENTFGQHSQTLDSFDVFNGPVGGNATTPSSAVANTRYKNVIFINKNEGKIKIEGGIIKRISKGHKIKARYPKADAFDFDPGYAFFFVSRFDPIICGSLNNLKRQCRYISFDVTFKDEPKEGNPLEKKINRNLEELIKKDQYKCAFFDILVSHYKNYIESLKGTGIKMVPHDEVVVKTKEYLIRNKLIDEFIDARVEITRNKKDVMSFQNLYALFVEYVDGDTRGFGTKKFKKRIAGIHGIAVKESHDGHLVLGIKPKH